MDETVFSEGKAAEASLGVDGEEDITDLAEDCDGDVLRPVIEGIGPSVPSGGSSMKILRGLSSMGAMRLEAMEARCDTIDRLSLTIEER